MSVASPYQRLVLTRFQGGIYFYINGGLQFSSHDEFIYHEAMVHPAMLAVKNPKKVLILGGGDGLALREVLKWEEVESVTLVDLDPIVTQTFSVNPYLREINQNAFDSPKVKVVNSDAYTWVREEKVLLMLFLWTFQIPIVLV